jgi:hypothetical protein
MYAKWGRVAKGKKGSVGGKGVGETSSSTGNNNSNGKGSGTGNRYCRGCGERRVGWG